MKIFGSKTLKLDLKLFSKLKYHRHIPYVFSSCKLLPSCVQKLHKYCDLSVCNNVLF